MSRYVILTKSGMRKTVNGESCTGVCVVAYSLLDHKLVRFVQIPGGIPLKGSYVRTFELLDEVEVPRSEPFPEKPQMENLLIPDRGIVRICKSEMTIAEIAEKTTNNSDGSYLNDMRPYLDSVSQYSHSVEIVKVTDLIISKPGNASQPRASFKIDSRIYRHFRVTDGTIKSHFDEDAKQTLQYDEAYLVITIPSVPYDKDNYYYKFISAIYLQPVDLDFDDLPF